MKQALTKPLQFKDAAAIPHASMDRTGLAVSPPSYGIGFVDNMRDRENRTGLPDNLKAGIENLSGLAMDDVRVHYNSSRPAELQALAYTQGTVIHIGPGQEQHLPHEAWHVVQQKRGVVPPRFQLKGEQINDDQGLEREAEVMGKQALQQRPSGNSTLQLPIQRQAAVIQRALGIEFECTNLAIIDSPDGAKKGDKIAGKMNKHWKMVYETTSARQPVVEFVVEPAVETKTELNGAVDAMMAQAKALDKDTPTKIADFEIEKQGEIEGAVQITMGLPLDALPQIYKEYESLSTGNRSFGYQTYLELVEDKGKKSAKGPDNVAIKALPPASKGFILLVLDYLKRGYVPPEFRKEFKFVEPVEPTKETYRRKHPHNPLGAHLKYKSAHEDWETAHAQWKDDYDKWERSGIPFVKGLFEAMNRTDFTTIFSTLPLKERERFAFQKKGGTKKGGTKWMMKVKWVDWFIRYGTTPSTLEKLSEEDAAKKIENLKSEKMINEKVSTWDTLGAGPQRGNWLRNMPHEDLLAKKNFMGVGRLGAKTDLFAKNNTKKAPIFELRAPYGSSIKYTDWGTVAKENWERYMKAVGDLRINRGK